MVTAIHLVDLMMLLKVETYSTRASGFFVFILIALSSKHICGKNYSYSNALYGEPEIQFIPSIAHKIEYDNKTKQIPNGSEACIAAYTHTSMLHNANIFDSISMEDLVKNQYMSLPYPVVSMEHIVMEQNHYLDPHRNDAFRKYPSIDVNNVNKFLFDGYHDFRYIENSMSDNNFKQMIYFCN